MQRVITVNKLVYNKFLAKPHHPYIYQCIRKRFLALDEGDPSNRGQGCHGHGQAARAMVRGSMSLDVGRRLYYSYVGDGICRILERKRVRENRLTRYPVKAGKG